MRAWRRRRCGLAAAVLAAALWLQPAEARAAAEVRVVSFNICGAICNQGQAGDLAEHVSDVVDSRAHLAVLDEVCRPKYNRLRQLLSEAGRAMAGAFHAQRFDQRCPGGFGDAVLSTGGGGKPRVIRLPNRPERRRAALDPVPAHGRPRSPDGLRAGDFNRAGDLEKVVAVTGNSSR